MVKKKIGIITMAVGAVVSMTACGSSDQAADNKSLTYLAGVAGDQFYISVGCAAKVEAKKFGYSLNIQAPQKWDVTLQRPILDSVVAKKPAALIVTPNDESALQTSLEQAKREGIKIVLSDTTTKDPSVAESAVTMDNVAAGAAAFDAIKAAHPDGGKVYIINSAPGISTGEDRGKGFKEAAKADSKFTFVGEQFGQDDNAKSAQLTAAALQKDSDIIGIFGTSGNESQGAATAVRQAGLKGKVTVVGMDAYPAQVKALEAGDMQALIAQKTGDVGTQSVLQAVNALEGKSVKKSVLTGSTILTKDNLNTPEGRAAVYKTKCS